MTALFIIYLTPAVTIPLLISWYEDKFPPPIAKTPFWVMALIGLAWPVWVIAVAWEMVHDTRL